MEGRMKKQIQILAACGFFIGLMAGSCLAVENKILVYEPLPGVTPPASTQTQNPPGTAKNVAPKTVGNLPKSNVPQAVIDYRNKRLDARMRRDNLLQMKREGKLPSP